MRRIRTPAAGEHVILDATPPKSSAHDFASVQLEVRQQFAVDADVRKLLDRIRRRLGGALVAGAGPDLAKHWSTTPIAGRTTRASSDLVDTARSAPAYLDKVADATAARIIPQVVREWLADAVPQSGDGVGTEARANTGGGPLR